MLKAVLLVGIIDPKANLLAGFCKTHFLADDQIEQPHAIVTAQASLVLPLADLRTCIVEELPMPHRGLGSAQSGKVVIGAEYPQQIGRAYRASHASPVPMRIEPLSRAPLQLRKRLATYKTGNGMLLDSDNASVATLMLGFGQAVGGRAAIVKLRFMRLRFHSNSPLMERQHHAGGIGRDATELNRLKRRWWIGREPLALMPPRPVRPRKRRIAPTVRRFPFPSHNAPS